MEKEPGWIKVYGKGGKERIVPLARAAHHALLTYRGLARIESGTDFFFTARTGQPLTPNAVEKVMNRIAAAANVPRLHAYLLRHTAATQYLVAGGDAISLQYRLGHTTLAMPSHYVHLAAQHLAMINERVSPMDKVKIILITRSRGSCCVHLSYYSIHHCLDIDDLAATRRFDGGEDHGIGLSRIFKGHASRRASVQPVQALAEQPIVPFLFQL